MCSSEKVHILPARHLFWRSASCRVHGQLAARCVAILFVAFFLSVLVCDWFVVLLLGGVFGCFCFGVVAGCFFKRTFNS